jgi:hypothetical protein
MRTVAMGDDTTSSTLRKIITGSALLDPLSGCWLWRRQISNSGYGKLMVGEDGGTRYVSAHWASYRAFVKPIADDQIVSQSCGNRLCVNPAHLQLLATRLSPKTAYHRRIR